jgi:hypothetical protein
MFRGSNPGRGKRFSLLHSRLDQPWCPPTQPPVQGVSGFFPRGQCGRGLALSTNPHLASRLGMSKAIPLLPLSAFNACYREYVTYYTLPCTLNLKVSLSMPWSHMGEQMHCSTRSLTSTLDGGEWWTSRLCHFIHWKEARYPLSRSVRAQTGLGGFGENVLPITGFRTPDLPARSQSLHWLR